LPIYGYRCQSCQREFETQQRMSEPPQAACPECGGAGTRLFYPAGILFKGSGFYKTDSRSTAAAATTPSSDSAKPDSAKPGSGTSEAAKPASTSTDSPTASPPPKPGGATKPASTATD
jgi:putative FmdB family regulatory protein